MRFGSCKSVALAAAMMVLAAPPAASLDMVVGDVTVQNLIEFGFDTQGSDAPGGENAVLSFDSGVTDELFQMFGYLGTAGGHVRIDNVNFDISSAIVQVGNTAVSQLTLSVAGAAALGLGVGDITVDYTFTLIDDTSALDEDRFGWDIGLTNTTAAAIDVSLYTYVDLDLNGSFGGDSATTDLSRMFVQDVSEFMWDIIDVAGATHFQVGDYPTVRTALNGMTFAQDLNDLGGAFGPGDFSGAYQFDRTIAAFATEAIALNTGVVPEPQPALLTGLGLVGLAFYGRRRRR